MKKEDRKREKEKTKQEKRRKESSKQGLTLLTEEVKVKRYLRKS